MLVSCLNCNAGKDRLVLVQSNLNLVSKLHSTPCLFYSVIQSTVQIYKHCTVHDSRTNINFTSLYPPVTTECISVCTIVVIVCMNISYACYMLYAYYICITLNVTAFKNQDHSLRDYRKYFKPLLCYMEGGWTTETQNIQEPFYSDRHHLDASSWLDLQNKVCIHACSNIVDIEAAVMKHRSEVRRQAFTSYQMVRGFSPGNILKCLATS